MQIMQKVRSFSRTVSALLHGEIPLGTYFQLVGQRGSFSITEAFVNQYHSMLLAQYQQDKSLIENHLDPMVVHRGVRGVSDSFERLGAVSAVDILTRHGDTSYLNPDHSKRWVNLVASEAAVLLDRADEVRTLIDAQSGYRDAIVRSLGRRADRHIFAAATGSAITGGNKDGTAVLPSAQAIVKGTTPNDVLTLAKIKVASLLLDAAAIPPGAANRVLLYAPGQTKALLSITQAASSDFTKHKIYDAGSMNGIDWMGFTWVLIPDELDQAGTVLNRMLALSTTTRTCVAFGRASIGLSVNQEIKTFIDILPQKRHSTQVRSEMQMGSVRIWDLGVVSIAALEETS